MTFSGVNVNARYVRVQLDGLGVTNEQILSLAEVEILGSSSSTYTNIALGSTASQSSTLSNPANPTADKAIDGDFNTAFGGGSTTHTDPNVLLGTPVFWETQLDSLSQINEIALHNRGDCCPERLSNFRVSIFNGVNEVWGANYFEGSGSAGNVFSVVEDTNGIIATGDRVRVELINGFNNEGTGPNVLSLREVEIYGVAVPEPSSSALLGLGILVLVSRRNK